MPVPPSILDLIQRFDDNAAEYRGEAPQYCGAAYNETEARREFIDPLFKALGWDMDNAQGYSEKYKEVVHEARVQVSGRVKAPDYAFRVGGRPVFFVEAKRPGVTLHAGREADEAAFQVRRYAWSAKLPVSVLTNFAEFALYDCRSKPARSESAGIGRVSYTTYAQFPECWDALSSLLAPEAIRKGALERFIASEKATRGTLAVDAAFLAEIEGWRDALARNFALRNPGLTVRRLNFAVQKTIDRIIFLRIAEDRGFEPYHRLGDLAQGKDIYCALGEVFRQADNRYNAGLFYFHRETERDEDFDDFTLNLQVDDKALKDIFTGLYYPESPYAFDALPADILGQVYEQFLGKVIRLTAGGRAKVEEKPEVKKAGGVYYTPTYIVDYIVEHTVGKLLEGKTWREIRGLDARGVQRYAPLRCLDPACGSGTFLLQAYQVLLDWYLEQYTAEDTAAHIKAGRLTFSPRQTGEGPGVRLTTEARKDILLTHIYGVDIDPQAVEVTKLSLLLKVLEGEDEQTLGQQLVMSLGKQERVLPDLGQNIRCGNSLIGSDFYGAKQLGLGLLDDEELHRINAFDWDVGFGKAMAAGGFDAVIGNPPYIRIQAMKEYAPKEVEFYKQAYVAAGKGNYDIYVVFVEKGLSLLRAGGRLGYILPSKFLTTDYGASLRTLLTQERVVDRVIDFGYAQVFENATTYTCLLFLNNSHPQEIQYIKTAPKHLSSDASQITTMTADSLGSDIWLFLEREGQVLLNKIAELGTPLLDLPAMMSRGTSSGADTVFCLKQTEDGLTTQTGEAVEIESDILRQPLYASDFTRYQFSPKNKERIIFPYTVGLDGYELIGEDLFRQKWPKAYKYLSSRKKELMQRKQYREWYGFSASRNLNVHDHADLLVPLLADRGLFALTPENKKDFCLMASGGFSVSLASSNCKLSPLYVLGLINSKLLFWNLKSISNKFRGGWITCTKQYFGTLPIRAIDFDDPADVACHDRMVALVERMLDLHRRLAAAQLSHEKRLLQQQIDVTDKAIDALVYALYDLTPEEIAIVEGATP